MGEIAKLGFFCPGNFGEVAPLENKNLPYLLFKKVNKYQCIENKYMWLTLRRKQ